MDLNIRTYFRKYLRVWKVLRKPSKDEFLMVAKISALGVLVIGAIGFAISLGAQLFLPSV